VKFNFPAGGALQARKFSHGNLGSPINPPAVGVTTTYGFSGTVVTMEVSVDGGQTWLPSQASGGVQARITHSSDSGGISFFDTEMLTLNLSGTSPFGPFMIRESPTRQSLGKHTIRSDPRGFRISSFFDVFLEVSVDNGANWTPADRSIRVQANSPAAAPNSIFITDRSGTSLTLDWLGSFQLQFADGAPTSFSDMVGVTTGPKTVSIGPTPKYFRLRQ
jgi:hypothetical protein